MMAGTSTGSIIASAMSYPNSATINNTKPDPYYYAATMIYLYSEKGKLIFQSSKISYVIIALAAAAATILFTVGGYFRGKHCYDNDEHLAEFEEIRETLEHTMKKAEDESIDLDESREVRE